MVELYPDCLVLFEDIEQYLIFFGDQESKAVLMSLLSDYLGFPSCESALRLSVCDCNLLGKFYYKQARRLLR